MDAERRLREPRPGVRRLRDISHLYLSGSRSSARFEATRQPAPRRLLRIALAGPGTAAARSAVGANLAVQLARLGRRTLVVDLDPALPGIGFRLGLAPQDALAHVPPGDGPRLARGFFGIRVLCGVAGGAEWMTQAVAARPELSDLDCVLLQVAAAPAAERMRELSLLFPPPPASSTLERAAARSPMIGAWLATAQRPANPEPQTPPTPVDILLWIVDAGRASEEPPAELLQALVVTPRRIFYGPERSPGVAGTVWARVPAHASPDWVPISALDPEHPAARTYEGFAQALLAASARPGMTTHA